VSNHAPHRKNPRVKIFLKTKNDALTSVVGRDVSFFLQKKKVLNSKLSLFELKLIQLWFPKPLKERGGVKWGETGKIFGRTTRKNCHISSRSRIR